MLLWNDCNQKHLFPKVINNLIEGFYPSSLVIKMDNETCINKLNNWAMTYVNGWNESTDTIIFKVEDIPASKTMGCYYRTNFSGFDNNNRRVHYVVLDTKLMTYPDYLIKSVLWHEFCHLWVRFEYGIVIESHGKEFKNRQKTVLRYWLGDYITKFLWGLY